MKRIFIIGAVAGVVALLVPVAVLAQRSNTLSAVQAAASPSAFVAEHAREGNRAEAVVTLLSTAQPLLGLRYRYGGTSPKRGFDCSGFVRHMFAQVGVELPRTAHEMASIGEHVGVQVRDTVAFNTISVRHHRKARGSITVASLLPGDLLFFSSPGTRERIDHVAIYAGDATVLHSTKHNGVRYDHIYSASGRWLLSRYVGARRVLPAREREPEVIAVDVSTGEGPEE
jgi:cell wall-associated NlpC family hydrolase